MMGGMALLALVAAPLAINPDNTSSTTEANAWTGGRPSGVAAGNWRMGGWHAIFGAEEGEAWNTFVTSPGMTTKARNGKTMRQVAEQDSGINVNSCKKSRVVFWLSNSTNREWMYNLRGNSYNAGDVTPKAWEVSGLYASESTGVRNWLGRAGAPRDYVLICDDSISPLKSSRVITTTSSTSAETTKNYEKTLPYSYTTTVTPQFINDADGKLATKDIIGEDNLTSQTETKKTKFGEVWDAVEKDSKMSASNLQTKTEAAEETDNASTHSSVTLNDKNKAGIAEGGVLNFTEQTQYATVSATSVTTTTTTKKCSQKQEKIGSGSWNNVGAAYDCESTTSSSTASTSKTVNGTLQNTGFWQMLAVHCNKAQFEALVASDSSLQVVNSGDDSKAISAVVYSKKYDQQPSVLDFGDKNNTKAAKSVTATIGFYDKECPFECTPSSTDGASATNGATSNVPNTEEDGKKRGAVSSGRNANSFEFFRDNDSKDLTVNLWYPKTTGVVSYDGSKALTTTVTRWADGTPGVSGTGGKFTMATATIDKNGKITEVTKLFTGTNSTAATQKNWDVTPSSNSTYSILSGQYNVFSVRASWASDVNKPQILNFKWEYAPTVSSNVITSGGFGVGGAQSVGTISKVSAKIQGKCYANFGTDGQLDMTSNYQTNTGTGTANNLDGKLLQGTGTDKQTNLITNFVRATTE